MGVLEFEFGSGPSCSIRPIPEPMVPSCQGTIGSGIGRFRHLGSLGSGCLVLYMFVLLTPTKTQKFLTNKE